MSSTQYGTVPGEESATTAFDQQRRYKQGKKFLGCCDMRRAAISVNSINLALISLQMYLYLMVMKSEDSPQELVMAARDTLRVCIVEAVLMTIAIWGVVTFNSKGVFAGVILYVIGIIVSIGLKNVPGFVFNGFFLVPNVLLIMEINRYVNLSNDRPQPRNV